MRMILPSNARHSGIDISYTKKRRELHIGGWYDSCVGIEPTDMPLEQFFRLLGITKKDCEAAFNKNKAHKESQDESGSRA